MFAVRVRTRDTFLMTARLPRLIPQSRAVRRRARERQSGNGRERRSWARVHVHTRVCPASSDVNAFQLAPAAQRQQQPAAASLSRSGE